MRLELSGATLEGTVTYQGKPVAYALIVVANNSDPASTGNANADGHYKLVNVPLGQVQVGVNSDVGRSAMSRIAGSQAKFVDVPKKYFEYSTSELSTTITPGTNTYDIVIE